MRSFAVCMNARPVAGLAIFMPNQVKSLNNPWAEIGRNSF
jgi:hypothetical protein